ncbi:MAG: CRTAC1 family protein [Proteobacteria bacterium]|nr:CRTAC1 family protein [Pseudomonadota bacterium]
MNQHKHIYSNFIRKTLVLLSVLVVILVTVFIYRYFSEQKLSKTIEHNAEYIKPTQETRKLNPPKTDFMEQAVNRGISMVQNNGAYGEKLLPETMGSGVALLDYDNDGDLDIFLSNGNNWPWSDSKPTENNRPTQKMFQNDGKGYFTDVSIEANIDDEFYGTGVAIADVNQDGYVDIFVAAVGKNYLYLNQQDGTFKISGQNLDCMKDAWSSSAGFFDYDHDGDDDLLVVNYVQWSRELDIRADYRLDGIGRAYGPPSNFQGTHNCLFKNENGVFSDVSESSGMIVKNPATGEYAAKGLALMFFDVNTDGWLDILIANDTTANQLFINDQNGRFTEHGGLWGIAYDSSGSSTGAMGIDASYYRNDEKLAIAVGNFANEMTSFYVNRNGNIFTDESMLSGIGPDSRLALSFGVFFFDYDLDGRQDFFQTNGHVEDQIQLVQASQTHAQKSQLFWNCGSDCKRAYQLVDQAGDLSRQLMVGRAAAYGDIDNDGDLDIIVTQSGKAVKLFINNSETANWLKIKLFSKNHQSLTGSIITVTTETHVQRFQYGSTKSYLSQVELSQTVGLGRAKSAKINIKTLQGKTIERTIDQVNQSIEIEL